MAPLPLRACTTLAALILALAAALLHTASSTAQQPSLPAPALTAHPAGGAIELTWTEVSGASHYELWAWTSDAGWQQFGGDDLTATAYTHTGLTVGTTYHYQVRAIEAGGNRGPWSQLASATLLADLAAPSLTAQPDQNAVELTWQQVPNAARYELWAWTTAAGWQQLDEGNLSDTNFTHAQLEPGTTYHYQMRALNAAGQPGPWSESASATVLAPPTPTATPTSTLAPVPSPTPSPTPTPTVSIPPKPVITAQLVAGAVELSWEAVPGAARYDLWTWTTAEGWQQLDDGSLTGTTFSHIDLAAGTTYFYAVRAVNAAGQAGDWSEYASAAVPVPPAPTATSTSTLMPSPTPTATVSIPPAPAITARLAAGAIELNWQAVTSAVRYELWTWTTAAGWQRLDDGNLTATTYLHAGLEIGTTYFYALRAVNTAGVAGPWSDYASAAFIEPPASPANVRYRLQGAAIVITWDASPNATHYKIYHHNTPNSGCTLTRIPSQFICALLAANVTATTYTHTSPDGSLNAYWVVACNRAGCAAIDDDNPARPAGTRPPNPTNVRYSLEGTAIVLTWDASPGATRYKVFHHNTANPGCTRTHLFSQFICDLLAANVTGTSYSHTDPDDRLNSYWVVACNSVACSEIDDDNPARPTGTKPANPANVRYSRDGASIVVTWGASQNATHYKVYHHNTTNPGCTLTVFVSRFICNLLSGHVTGATYTHTNPDDRLNSYWVVACNRAGCSEIDDDNPAQFIGTRPANPTNLRYSLQAASILLTWDASQGATHYKVYHHNTTNPGCTHILFVRQFICDLLDANVTGTTYTHTDPDDRLNAYWVVACNSAGCAEIDDDNPAQPTGTKPANPTNPLYSRAGASIVLTWDASQNATHYKVYHHETTHPGCTLTLFTPLFICDLLSGRVTGTTYTHTNPDPQRNTYWVVACNTAGCASVDDDNPAQPASP